MKNTFGNSLTLTLFGESHGEYIGAVLDGLAPGIRIDREYISARLEERKPHGKISTARVEADEFIIASGEFDGYTTGAPLTVLIKNENTRSKDYSALKVTPRPSHADYTAECKYRGFQDYRGGGHFSGRVTAALVAACAIVRLALLEKGIKIGSHITELHGASDRRFENIEKDIDSLSGKEFPTLTDRAEENMRREIEKAAAMGDSVGGILETAVIGIPAGVGEPWFDTLEGVIAHALFSVPAVKGVEFGAGFAFADMYGSEANDPFTVEDGKVVTVTNNNGGINGGISNGMPIIFNTAIKPTPSIFKAQGTVDLEKMTDATLKLEGRHDPAVIHRARAVVEAVAALAVADMLCVKYGTDYLSSEK